MRESCIFCTIKHLMTAMVLLREYRSDPNEYKLHYFYAMGELVEAGTESEVLWPVLSTAIRDARLELETGYPDGVVDFDGLLELAVPIWDKVSNEESNII